jgi:O-antigen/teichoic acid export membrane protein
VLAKGKTFFRGDYWKFCLALALPSVFYNLSDLILGQSDRVMLQQMLSASAVGQYSLALNFGGIMFTIFGALNKCWTPFFFDDFKAGHLDRVHSQGKNFLELFTVLSIGFILLAPEVYHIFASREFWDGTVLIPIFVSSYFLNFLCTFPVNFEYYHKKNKAVAVVTIASSLINIGLNYILIRRMGMVGAAMATAISHSLQLTMHYIYCRYVIGARDYPFGIRLWGKYALCFFGVVALVYASGGIWYLRWIPGAALGLWELHRISKRKVLI